MRKGWTYQKLGEITEYPNRRLKIDQLGPNSFVGVEQLIKDRGGVMFSDAAPTAESAIAYQCNDILIGNIRPYLRKIWLADRAGGASGDIVIIRIREDYSKILDAKYLYKALSSEQFFDFDNANTKGAKMPRGDRAAIAKYPIPVPPLAEQERIVAELDLLQGIIDKQKAQQKELDTLAQSIFYDMFGDPVENDKGWPSSTLLDISTGKLSYGSGASAIDYDGKIRYIRITDIDDNGSLRGEAVSPSDYCEKYLLHDGDILFARTGATVGKTYLHKKENGNCIYAGYLIRLVPNKDLVLPEYVFGFTKTLYYKRFVALAQKAVAQPNINAEQYGSLLIGVPPLPLQQAFATKIEAIEHQKASINASIAETQKLFDYTMDKYFG